MAGNGSFPFLQSAEKHTFDLLKLYRVGMDQKLSYQGIARSSLCACPSVSSPPSQQSKARPQWRRGFNNSGRDDLVLPSSVQPTQSLIFNKRVQLNFSSNLFFCLTFFFTE